MIAESAALYTIPLLIGTVLQLASHESEAWIIPLQLAQYMAVGYINFLPFKFVNMHIGHRAASNYSQST